VAHDRRTALRAGTESTGHAIPHGEVFGPFPTNLFIAAGDQTFDDLLGSLDRGLLVTEFNYCRILDPKTQVVTGLTRNGTFLVEKGKITRAVKNLRFTQSFLDALGPGNVKGVESSTRFADGEFGPGMVVAPSIHLAEWNFTGGARG
jgi:predicted Zn-dependent protease